MLPASAAYKRALHFPHKRRTDIDVIDADGTVLATRIPFNSGSVSASLTQRVTRSLNLTLSADADRLRDLPGGFFPDDPDDLLSPTHALLRVRSGIEYADGSSELFPVFLGRVREVQLDAGGIVSLRADDRAAEVVDFRFEQPRRADRPTILTQIRTLIGEAVPGATFGTDDVADATTPELTWDEDRGRAVDDLAEALGARWYALGSGDFVVRAFPYDNGTVVQTIEEGPQGLLSAATITRSRDGAANSVTVVSERVDGTDPVRVTARNTVASSPTFFGDRFGRVSQVIKIQTPLTNSEAQRFARAQLNASTALTEQWAVSCVPDHTLEPGDPVRLRSRERTAVQVIDSITYPLGLGEMSFTTRAFSIPPVSLGS